MGKSQNQAIIVNQKTLTSIRYRWIDEEEEPSYFEFAIHKWICQAK